ncbi:MAG: DUF3016 domain-containing protein [Oceanipulchritudo sp.]
MKTKLIQHVIGLFSLTGLIAFGSPLAAAEVKIDWEDPETFSDVEEYGYYSETLFERFSNKFEEFVKEEAAEYLPEEAKLALTVKDVDLAGEFEFWRGPDFDDVRIIKEIYPPRLKFDYALTDADGEVVREGLAQITDTTYLWNVANPGRRSDEFYYERELIEDWLRRELDDLDMDGN